MLADALQQAVFIALTAAFRTLRTLVRWCVMFPAISLPIVACGAVTSRWGESAGTGAALLNLLLFSAWRVIWPGGFRRCMGGRIQVRWRAWSRYQQPWAETCALHGLTSTLNN